MPQSHSTDSSSDEELFIDVPCLICGSSQRDTIASKADIQDQLRLVERFHQQRRRPSDRERLADRAEFTQDYATSVVECRICGFVFRTPRPSCSSVASAYEGDRYSDAHLHAEFLSQREWAEHKASTLARWLQFRHTPVVVEVGSFVGGFLSAGKDRGWSMLGVDPGKEVTEFCRNRNLPVYCGTLADAPVVADSVDAVTVWNTFDQLPNPDTTIAAARQALRDRGLLIIRVPNGALYRRSVQYLRRRGLYRTWAVATLAWNNLLAFPYLYGYSISTLDELLSRHGFTRLMVYRDTLVTLANQETKSWAAGEEKLIKWCCRCVSAAESLWSRNSADLTPWLDIYYGISEDVPSTPVSVARFPRAHLQPNPLADYLPGIEDRAATSATTIM